MKFFRKNLRVRGMTLIETLVAISVMLIGMLGFTYLFVRSWQTNSFVLEEGMASAAASRTTNVIVGELRRIRQGDNGDYPIESASGFDLKVYLDVDRDGVTERIHYYLVNEQLMKGITDPTSTTPVTYPSADTTVSVMTNFVTNSPSQPIFFYYNGNYPSDTTNNPLPSPVAIGDVALVRVRLYVNIDPVNAPNNIVIESFAYLRNLVNYD